jgi:GTP pyrophosphokinase
MMAERLHNMRTVEFMDEKTWKKKAAETVEVFLPLAARLGNEKLTAELNDLALKYL